MRSCSIAMIAVAAWAGAAGAQTSGRLTREGGYWVETSAGETNMGNAVRFRIRTRGPVSLDGVDGNDVRYTLRKRVRAASESQARRLLVGIQVILQRQGELVDLEVRSAQRNLPMPDLEVAVPRGLRQTAISTLAGGIVVQDLTGSLDAETGGGRVEIGSVGGAMTARTGGGEIRIGRAGGTLRAVTAGGPIYVRRTVGEAWFTTGGGEIVVEEAVGPVHASTGAGNVEVMRAGSSVSARTAGGLIKVMDAVGSVNAESAGGAIQVGSARGVNCEAVAGGIRLTGVSGEVNCATAAGSILAELLTGRVLANSFLSTGSGDITVIIPSNLAVTIKALNESLGRLGRIVSDFPEVREETAVPGRIIAAGAINGGGPLLTIAAAEGTIFLRRQK